MNYFSVILWNHPKCNKGHVWQVLWGVESEGQVEGGFRDQLDFHQGHPQQGVQGDQKPVKMVFLLKYLTFKDSIWISQCTIRVIAKKYCQKKARKSWKFSRTIRVGHQFWAKSKVKSHNSKKFCRGHSSPVIIFPAKERKLLKNHCQLSKIFEKRHLFNFFLRKFKRFNKNWYNVKFLFLSKLRISYFLINYLDRKNK